MLDLRAGLLNAFQCRSLNLQSKGRLNSCQLHVQTIFDGHGPSVGETRKLELGVHFLDELVVGHPRTPLFTRLEHDGRVVHIERRVIGCAVGAPDRPEYTLDFGERPDDPVLLLQELRGLSDRDSRQGRWHVKGRALEQRRHKLASQFHR